jgi:tripartite-type tricarboxylate transporter receptor subunit TctC
MDSFTGSEFAHNAHPMTFTRRALLAATGAAALPAFAQPAYPGKPIHLVVPFTPGGSTDILARAIGQELTKAWGQAVVIENVPGAGGSIGAEKVAKAAPDGSTLLMGHIGTLGVNPSLYPKLGYDPVKSFAPVAWVARVPNVLAVHPSVPARTFQEFIELARSQPGKLNYGSGGNGSAAHTATEYLKLVTKTSLLHIPYRGTAPAVNDLLAGNIQLLFTGAPTLLNHLRAGKIRALAVSSPKRLSLLPDVPTVAESGVPGTQGFEADQWYGIVAPAGTPAAVVQALNEQVNKSLSSPEVKARLVAEGAEPTPTTPQAFGQLIASEIQRWAPVIKAGNMKAE